MNKAFKKKKHRKLKIFAVVMAAIIVAVTILSIVFVDNKNIEYEYFAIASSTDSGEEIKIVHLSDLHFPQIETSIDALIEKLLSERPDIVAITGDLVDSSATVATSGVADFLHKLKGVAPVYYVYGNHEMRNYENLAEVTRELQANGITILQNESVNIEIRSTEITLIGLTDDVNYDKKLIENTPNADTNYKILLAHRPERWDSYISPEKDFAPNLILTGHAHGGQFRLFGQGLVAPDQGLFPKFDGGRYSAGGGNSHMIVSRGIGNSLFPLRFNNNPHVPIITITL